MQRPSGQGTAFSIDSLIGTPPPRSGHLLYTGYPMFMPYRPLVLPQALSHAPLQSGLPPLAPLASFAGRLTNTFCASLGQAVPSMVALTTALPSFSEPPDGFYPPQELPPPRATPDAGCRRGAEGLEPEELPPGRDKGPPEPPLHFPDPFPGLAGKRGDGGPGSPGQPRGGQRPPAAPSAGSVRALGAGCGRASGTAGSELPGARFPKAARRVRDAAGPELQEAGGEAARRYASALSHRAQRGDRAGRPPLRAASAAPATLAARSQTPLAASGPRAAAGQSRRAGRGGGTGRRGALRGAADPAGQAEEPRGGSVPSGRRSALSVGPRRVRGTGSPAEPSLSRGSARSGSRFHPGPAPPAAPLTFSPVRCARGPGFARRSGQQAASLRAPARCYSEAASTTAPGFVNIPGCADVLPVTRCAVSLPAPALALFHLCSRSPGMEASLQRG